MKNVYIGYVDNMGDRYYVTVMATSLDDAKRIAIEAYQNEVGDWEDDFELEMDQVEDGYYWV